MLQPTQPRWDAHMCEDLTLVKIPHLQADHAVEITQAVLKITNNYKVDVPAPSSNFQLYRLSAWLHLLIWKVSFHKATTVTVMTSVGV